MSRGDLRKAPMVKFVSVRFGSYLLVVKLNSPLCCNLNCMRMKTKTSKNIFSKIFLELYLLKEIFVWIELVCF